MPRDGAIIFRDIVGKLDVLTVECDKCGRRGRYQLDRLIERYGIDAKLFDWEPEADCPRKHSKDLYDQCDADGQAAAQSEANDADTTRRDAAAVDA